MKYLLLMYANGEAAPKAENEVKAIGTAWYMFMKEANDAGVLLENNGMDPEGTATTIRVREGKTLVTDGPFAETHEQLGGYSVVECANLDEAIRWAEKIPTVKYGSIEVRPLWEQKA
jgi:hypothetical protein